MWKLEKVRNWFEKINVSTHSFHLFLHNFKAGDFWLLRWIILIFFYESHTLKIVPKLKSIILGLILLLLKSIFFGTVFNRTNPFCYQKKGKNDTENSEGMGKLLLSFYAVTKTVRSRIILRAYFYRMVKKSNNNT